MKSIVRKFYITGMALLLSVALAIAILFYVFKTGYEEQIKQSIVRKSDEIANVITAELAQRGQLISSAAIYVQVEQEHEKILLLLQRKLTSSDTFTSIYFGTPDNKMINASGWTPPSEFDLRTRPWYMRAIANNGLIFTETFLNASRDKYIITMAEAVYVDNQLLGVVAGDIPISKVIAFLDGQKISENGYSFLVDGKGNILAYSEENTNLLNPKNIEDVSPNLALKLKEEYQGYAQLEIEGEIGYTSFDRVDGTDWVIVSFVPLNDFRGAKQYFYTVSIAIIFIVICVILFIINRFRKEIILPLKLLESHIEALSMDNNLEYRLPVFEKDIFKETRKIINTILSSNQEYFMNLKVKEEELLTSNLELSSAMNQLLATEESLSLEVEEKKASQKQLEMIISLMSGSEEGIFILDDRYKCIFHNNSFARIIGTTKEEVELIDFLQEELIINGEIIAEVQKAGQWSREFEFRNKNDEEWILFLRINQLVYEDERYYTGNIINLTSYKQNEKNMYYLMYFDPLTKLHNRVYLLDSLHELLQENENQETRYALVIVNIDNFRMINEARGFSYGNKVLIALSKRLKSLIHEEDTIARLSNDEFAIVKKDVKDFNKLQMDICRLDQNLNQDFEIDGENIFISISMGISIYPTDGKNTAEILKGAVSALNTAKADKFSNFHFYNEKLNQYSVSNYEMRNQLKNALTNGEFELYYQPKFNMKTKEIIGMEALIRWVREGKLIPPMEFIPIAEESKLIIPMGEWVIKEACSFAYNLFKTGKEMSVAVNISRLQFKSPYIIELVKSVLQETKLPAYLLELEITESILMENAEECRETIEELKRIGVTISIDDFGTGYSSLSYLKKFAVDQVKIDRSFIKDFPWGDDGTIAKVIIELAEKFGLEVIAEGVETQEQQMFLLGNNCENAQGYLYSKPLSKVEFLDWLKAR